MDLSNFEDSPVHQGHASMEAAKAVLSSLLQQIRPDLPPQSMQLVDLFINNLLDAVFNDTTVRLNTYPIITEGTEVMLLTRTTCPQCAGTGTTRNPDWVNWKMAQDQETWLEDHGYVIAGHRPIEEVDCYVCFGEGGTIGWVKTDTGHEVREPEPDAMDILRQAL